jgi:hypothetical protein
MTLKSNAEELALIAQEIGARVMRVRLRERRQQGLAARARGAGYLADVSHESRAAGAVRLSVPGGVAEGLTHGRDVGFVSVHLRVGAMVEERCRIRNVTG